MDVDGRIIPPDHVHYFQPVRLSYTDAAMTMKELFSQCICGLEERRSFRDDDSCYDLRYRFQGMWLVPLDLLRIANSLTIRECPDCRGLPTLTVCPTCQALTVVEEDGQPIRKPPLATNMQPR